MIHLDSDSDSDLEVIAEVGGGEGKTTTSKSRKGQTSVTATATVENSESDDDDDGDDDIDYDKEELPDIDDDYLVPVKKNKEAGKSTSLLNKNKPGPSATVTKPSSNGRARPTTVEILEDDEDDKFQEDLKRAIRLSLCDKPGPSSRKMDMDLDDVDLGNWSDDSDDIAIESEKKTNSDGDSLPSISSPVASSSTSRGSSCLKRSFEDAGSQEIDDIFQELEYGSLADYLADKEKAKAGNQNPNSGTTASKWWSQSQSSCSSSSLPSSSLEKAKPKPPSSSTSSSTLAVAGPKSKSSKPKASPKIKLKLPSTLRSGAFNLGSPSPESSEKRKPIFSRVDPVALSLGSPDKSPTSYRIDPKQFRKANNQNKSKAQPGKGKKAGKEGSQSSSSAGGGEEDSQNPPSSVASSNSSLKLKGDMKSMVLKIHKDICSDDLAARLTEKELQYELVDYTPVDGLILFEHHILVNAYDKLGQCTKKDIVEPDDNAMIVFPIENHLELLQNEVEVINNDSEFSGSSHSQTLTEWVKEVKKKLQGKKITLLIQGHDAYIRKVRKNLDKEYRNRILNANEGENGNGKKKRAPRSKVSIQLTKTEIQSVLIHVQLHSQINYRLYEKPAELSEMLSNYTKSISEAPAKIVKMNQPGFDWYAVSDSVGGVPVDEDGKGMKSLWIHQLAQFPGVGQDMAMAVARVYKSPRALFKAYRGCKTADEGKNMLVEIPVTIGVGPLKKTRRLGPEASKKIYRFFTSTDGERELSV